MRCLGKVLLEGLVGGRLVGDSISDFFHSLRRRKLWCKFGSRVDQGRGLFDLFFCLCLVLRGGIFLNLFRSSFNVIPSFPKKKKEKRKKKKRKRREPSSD